MKKVERNDPCPCGSGKKYKQCCLKRDEALASSKRAETASVSSNTLQEAIEYHQAGRLSQAEAIYQQILQVNPSHPDALHLLGVVAHQEGKDDLAVELIGKAIRANPGNPMCYINLGNALKDQGKLDAAVESYHKALSLKPDFIEAHYNLGNALHALGKLDAAVESYRNVLSLSPNYADAHSNLALVLQEQSNLDEAIEHYRLALSLQPGNANTHCNMGTALQKQGELDAAVKSFQRAILLSPNFAGAHNNLGVALQKQGELVAAAKCYQQALLLKPELAEAYLNLGNVCKEQGRLDEAIEHYRKALAIKPNYVEAHYNLGGLLKDQECNQDEAIEHYRKALTINPNYVEAHSDLIFTLDLAAKDMSALFMERKKWDEIHAAPLWQVPSHTNNPDPTRRLRIGYVSPDFMAASPTRIYGGMLVQFDRSQFDVFAYSNSYKSRDDAVTELFRKNVTAWRNIVGLSDEVVTKMIREDQIDILVDLSGHGGGNRLLVFARKPAPIQITAWGYAHGTGLRAMDVFFTDLVSVLPHEQQYFSEEVRYLPSVVGSFFNEPFPDVNELPALSGGIVTFGSFNRLAKVSAATYGLWADVLLATPRSRLILKAPELSDEFNRERVARYFTKAGVATDRVIMLGRTSWYMQMQAYNQIDIALDPFPHGGGLTALEGLIMGVPQITLRWPTTAGRVSASIMTTLGLTDWITETQEEYVKLAIQKANDLHSLADLRQRLRSIFNASVIGDQVAYTRVVEKEYRLLWQEWCARRSP
jgi:predicted O-linked N-acetylglucosamine transferase (SPINDLY family)